MLPSYAQASVPCCVLCIGSGWVTIAIETSTFNSLVASDAEQVRSKVLPQAKSKKQNILVDRDPSHGHGHVGCALRANSLVACVAWLTIALHQVLLAWYAYCKPSNTTCGQHSEAISTAIACDGYQEGVVRVQRDCFALALCLWQDLASHLLFACGRTLLRTCSASLATSEFARNC